jgi:hypothetical protein
MKDLLQESELHRYWRFEAQGIPDPKYQGKKALERLRLTTLEFLDRSVAKQSLAKVVRVLVRQCRERADTPAWESFALQISYLCSKQPCGRSIVYPNRQALLRHWTWDQDDEFSDDSWLAKVEDELDLCRVFE